MIPNTSKNRASSDFVGSSTFFSDRPNLLFFSIFFVPGANSSSYILTDLDGFVLQSGVGKNNSFHEFHAQAKAFLEVLETMCKSEVTSICIHIDSDSLFDFIYSNFQSYETRLSCLFPGGWRIRLVSSEENSFAQAISKQSFLYGKYSLPPCIDVFPYSLPFMQKETYTRYVDEHLPPDNSLLLSYTLTRSDPILVVSKIRVSDNGLFMVPPPKERRKVSIKNDASPYYSFLRFSNHFGPDIPSVILISEDFSFPFFPAEQVYFARAKSYLHEVGLISVSEFDLPYTPYL